MSQNRSFRTRNAARDGCMWMKVPKACVSASKQASKTEGANGEWFARGCGETARWVTWSRGRPKRKAIAAGGQRHVAIVGNGRQRSPAQSGWLSQRRMIALRKPEAQSRRTRQQQAARARVWRNRATVQKQRRPSRHRRADGASTERQHTSAAATAPSWPAASSAPRRQHI